MRESLNQELRLIARGLLRARGFSIAVIATLVLAVGVNAAVFSATEAVLLNPIPAADLARVVAVETELPTLGFHRARIAPAEVGDIGSNAQVFEVAAGYRDATVDYSDGNRPVRVEAVSTLGDFFGVFAVRPALGRLYGSADTKNGDTHVAVLSHEAWLQLTGGDRAAIGKTLHFNGQPFRLVGVLPPGFRFPRDVELWTPLALDSLTTPTARGMLTVNGIARLRDGVSFQTAQAALTLLHGQLLHAYPAMYAANRPQYLTARPLAEAIAGELRPILMLLLAAAAFVLLIASANIASLELVRTIGRSRELAVRTALGASRWNIVRWLAGETLVLATIGLGLGVALALLVTRLVRASDAPQLAMLRDVRLDLPGLAFSCATTLVAAVMFGMVPVLRSRTINAADALRANAARGASGSARQSRTLRAVVVAQFALALVLALGSQVAYRSLEKLIHSDPGFSADGLVAAAIALPETQYATGGAKLDFHDRVMERLRADPIVTAVGSVRGAPFVSVQEIEHSMSVREAGAGAKDFSPVMNYWVVGGDYFRAMGIPLRSGRLFDATDRDSAGPRRVVIDEITARTLFPGRSAIGKRLDFDMGTVIGVVGAVAKADLATPMRGPVYVPIARFPSTVTDFTLVVRTRDARVAASAIQTAVKNLDSRMPMPAVVTMRDAINRSLGARRLASNVLAAFAALSVALAVLGIYGVMSYSWGSRSAVPCMSRRAGYWRRSLMASTRAIRFWQRRSRSDSPWLRALQRRFLRGEPRASIRFEF